MSETARLRLAIQKSGRLSKKSIALLEKCGIDFEPRNERLFWQCEGFPIDIMLVRDDDIPEYVQDGVCDLGIVGHNILEEKLFSRQSLDPSSSEKPVEVLRQLGFGHCRLSFAVPKEVTYDNAAQWAGKRIATSYPNTLKRWMADKGVAVEVVEISGSVEIAPELGIADAVCDLVSTGATLRINGLREAEVVLQSEAVLARTGNTLEGAKADLLRRLLNRIEGVMKAEKSKYIMMNAPSDAVEKITDILPGIETPTVLPLAGSSNRVAIHAVAVEKTFWETMEKLKEAGATSILVVPIEKLIV